MSLKGRDYSLRTTRRRPGRLPLVLFAGAGVCGLLAIDAALERAGSEQTAHASDIEFEAPVARAPTPTRVADFSPVSSAEAAMVPVTPDVTETALDLEAEQELDDTVAADWLEMTVARGDTLSGLFNRYDLPAADWIALSRTDGAGDALTRIRPGDTLRVERDTDGRVRLLEYPLDRITTLRVSRDDDGFAAETVTADVETREAYASGTIRHSLFGAANASGLTDKLTMELANIFGWDIDFVLDIRSGDRFAVIYQERFIDGEKIGDGPILAAEFINRGRVMRAVRFETPEGEADYYTPDGDSMRKAFLRSPVEFARISSGFSLGRRHPVLNTIRAHRGTDYAAPTGTPIRAAGDGKVIFAGTKGGYGRTVILQHGRQYTTLYAHMNSFRRGIRSGTRVKQGQTIGYVGSSGLATGPHLHYEFRVDGVHRNPVTVSLPRAHPVAASLRPAFEEAVQPMLAQLDVLARTQQVADASSAQTAE